MDDVLPIAEHRSDRSPTKQNAILEKLRFFVMDLQVITPIVLLCFAAATLGFLINDAVEEMAARKSEAICNAMFDVASVSMYVAEVSTQTTSPTFLSRQLSAIANVQTNSELESFGAAFAGVSTAIRANQTGVAAMGLHSIQLSLFEALNTRLDTLDASGGLMFATLLNIHLSQEAAGGLMQMDEGQATASRGMKAMGLNVMCTPHIAQWVQKFFPTALASVSCDTAAQTALRSATKVDTTLEPEDFNGIIAELSSVKEAYRLLLEDIRSEFTGTYASDRGYPKRIAVLAVALILSSIGTVACVFLVVGQYRSLHEQSVVESDFDCNAQRVKIRAGTLRTVDELASRIGVMGDLEAVFLKGPGAPGGRRIAPSGNQIELHMRRAVEPLQLLRPFVPKYMYLHNLRSQSVMARSASALLRNSEMLNLNTGLKKKPVSILFVGLRTFNKADANLELLNELLSAVHLACSHFQGHVIQMSSDGVVATFSRATINEDGDGDERMEDGEVLAVHAAMAVLGICSAPLERPDGTVREPFAVSMAVSHSIAFSGIVSFHVSKQFALLAPAVAHAIAVEPLNDIHSSSILTSAATNDLISDHFITRPVHYLPGVGSVYHVIVARPEEGDADYESTLREQTKMHEKTANWKKVWEKYEALVSTDKPSYEMLEEAYRDLEGYKVFQMDAAEEDIAYNLALSTVKRTAQHLGVNLGSTMEEE